MGVFVEDTIPLQDPNDDDDEKDEEDEERDDESPVVRKPEPRRIAGSRSRKPTAMADGLQRWQRKN